MHCTNLDSADLTDVIFYGAFLVGASFENANITGAKFDLRQHFKGHTSSVYCVNYSYNGKYIASGSYDKSIKLWDCEDGTCLKTLDGHTNSVKSVTFSCDDKMIASASWDNTVKVWYIESRKCI